MIVSDIKYIIELLKKDLSMIEINFKHAESQEEKDKINEQHSRTALLIIDLKNQIDALPVCLITEKTKP